MNLYFLSTENEWITFAEILGRKKKIQIKLKKKY